jgi:spermidine synthase
MKDGWFTEYSTMWPGMGMSLKVKNVLYQAKSDFQVR